MTFLLCSVQLGTTKCSEVIFLASRKILLLKLTMVKLAAVVNNPWTPNPLQMQTQPLPLLCFPLLFCQLWTETCQQLQYAHKKRQRSPLTSVSQAAVHKRPALYCVQYIEVPAHVVGCWESRAGRGQRHTVAVHDQQALALRRLDLRGVAAPAGRSTCILRVSHTCSIDFRYPDTPTAPLLCLWSFLPEMY